MTSTTSTRSRAAEDGTTATGDAATSPPDVAEAVLAVEGVERSFGDLTVLDGVTTAIAGGEVAALIGPNGSGKTTLIRIIAGLLDADAGSVSVDAEAPRAVGYLPQAPRFRPQLTVAETLSFYAGLVDGGVGVEAALERVGLAAVHDRRIEALSGGMVRLVGLAQALLGDPALLVLDEPTSSLDPAMTAYLYDVIEELADGGTAVLLSTHDLDVSRLADRILLLDRGELVVDDTPEAVCRARDAETLSEAFVATVGRRRTVQTRGASGASPGSGEPPAAAAGGDGEAGSADADTDAGGTTAGTPREGGGEV